jgi:hypothetical protein
LSPEDKIISFGLGQFSLLWIDQMQRYNFDVDVIECKWGVGTDLVLLKQKLQANRAHFVKAVSVVHNETSIGVTNNIGPVRCILGNTTSTSRHATSELAKLELLRVSDNRWTHARKASPAPFFYITVPLPPLPVVYL